MEFEPLCVGFIGAGGFASHTLYLALHLAPLNLQAVCDLDKTRAKKMAGKFGTGRCYTDYRRLWEEEDIEAVIICMGPESRQSLVLKALDAVYHVFVPKPPAMTLTGAIELAEASRRTGKILMVNFQRRFSLGVLRALEIMRLDGFGQVTQLLGSFCSGQYKPKADFGASHVYLLDFAIHYFD